jgi:hypothetical protein
MKNDILTFISFFLVVGSLMAVIIAIASQLFEGI